MTGPIPGRIGVTLADPNAPDGTHAEYALLGDWGDRVMAVVDRAHAENWGGKHRSGFCEACADAHIVAQYASPGGPSGDALRERHSDADRP